MDDYIKKAIKELDDLIDDYNFKRLTEMGKGIEIRMQKKLRAFLTSELEEAWGLAKIAGAIELKELIDKQIKNT